MAASDQEAPLEDEEAGRSGAGAELLTNFRALFEASPTPLLVVAPPKLPKSTAGKITFAASGLHCRLIAPVIEERAPPV